ncbi:GspE/PulE family protein [Syntrophomonas palmitatica]|uniref:GspE/PulE family protein n=1 Tax=Syntrophomonas palmitatica TaxID=402877 RepID=UPI000A5C076D|nr:GspE/PulE family protein [Syntrophomonas palmitatica]
MAMDHKMLGEILTDLGVINQEQLAAALDEQNQTNEKLGQVLVRRGILTEQQLLETLEFVLGIPQVQISKITIDPEAVKLVPPQIIRTYKVLPVSRHRNSLTLVMADPFNQQAIDDVRMASGLDVIPVITSERDLEIAIRQYLAFRMDPGMERILKDLNQESRNMQAARRDLQVVKVEDDAPIIRMVNSILIQAVQGRASDIHVEPQEEETRIRFRIDGELYEVLTLPQTSMVAVVSRLKIQSGMDIAEKRVPQDGRFRMIIENREIDFRVSSLPTNHGEKIVLRILDRGTSLARVDQLGLSPANMEKLMALAHRPHGMVVVTGPTGSGKTTTLYAVLNEINSIDKNVITLEDPIEYSLPGINQVQTNPKAGLTFASGLRSILRQDPDIIMVGEVRDEETARLAVQAALTGHLVLSTLHTNSAAGTVARLSDIGIENFLLASSLSGVVSQRLVRKLCTNCRQVYRLDEETAVRIGIPEQSGQEFFRHSGCNICRQLGYQGRMALHEIIVVGPELRLLINRGELSETIIEQTAIAEGMVTIRDDGIEKAKKGLTSLEEVMKVVLLGG